MIRNFLCLIALIFYTVSLNAQDASRFFNRSELMTVGSYYYPEQWPRSQWERDLKKLAETGFEFTHFGEFAWSFIEPQDGKFDFKWLDEAVEIAHKNGVKVVMCTSSPAPPIWLVAKHPEVLMVNQQGTTMQHGSRQHISWSSAVYRRYVSRMTEAIAKHYAGDDRIWGWQLDNEPSHYGQVDHSDAARLSFQRWLKEKYKSIDSLNKVWGNAFWSLRYDTFSQIRTPNATELIAQPNPHAVLDFKRFSADEVADFMHMQAAILRKHIPENQWITTNLMPEHADVDPERFSQLDFVTYTKYLVAGYDMGTGDQGFRLGSATSIAFANDYFRSINGLTGVMELQPGQVNWGAYNPQTMPGAVRMWIWHAFAGGNKFVCNYRFRQPLTGGEQYHYGIIGPDGISPSSSGLEYIKVNKELDFIRRNFDSNAVIPAEHKARYAGLLYSPDNRWEQDNQRQTTQWDYLTHLKKYYTALKSMGAPVDVISEGKNFNKYPVLVAPAYQLLDLKLVERWRQYVEQGGQLLLTSRTGQKDRDGKIFEAAWCSSIQSLISGTISFYDHLPSERIGTIDAGKEKFTWNNWADILEPYPNIETWAEYSNQFYSGRPAVIHKKVGKGSVTYIGPDTDDGALEKSVLKRIYMEAGIPIRDLPDGVMLEWRDGFWIGLNYGSKPFELPISAKANILIGSKSLKTAEVTIWKD